MNVASEFFEHESPRRIRHPAATLLRAGALAAMRAMERAASALRARATLKSSSRQMHVLETLALGSRRQLLLVECDGQRYLVGAGSEHIGTILAIGTRSGKDNTGSSGGGSNPVELVVSQCSQGDKA